MSDHNERGCRSCGSYLHHEDDCPAEMVREAYRVEPAPMTDTPERSGDAVPVTEDRWREIRARHHAAAHLYGSAPCAACDVLREYDALRSQLSAAEERCREVEAAACALLSADDDMRIPEYPKRVRAASALRAILAAPPASTRKEPA